jgi:type VI protein secretion system component Hcp
MSQHLRLFRWPLLAVALGLAVAVALSLARPAESSAAATVFGKVSYTGLDGGTTTVTSTITAFDLKYQLAAATGGGGTGKAAFGDPRLVQTTSALSPQLMHALAGGRHLRTVKVVLYQPSSSKPFQSWLFTDAQLSAVQQNRTRSPGPETVSFRFAKVTQTVFKANGTTVAATSCWDLVGNKAC